MIKKMLCLFDFCCFFRNVVQVEIGKRFGSRLDARRISRQRRATNFPTDVREIRERLNGVKVFESPLRAENRGAGLTGGFVSDSRSFLFLRILFFVLNEWVSTPVQDKYNVYIDCPASQTGPN